MALEVRKIDFCKCELPRYKPDSEITSTNKANVCSDISKGI